MHTSKYKKAGKTPKNGDETFLMTMGEAHMGMTGNMSGTGMQSTSYRDFSDLDFIRNLDRVSSDYYADYMQGRGENKTVGVDSFVSRLSVEGCKGRPYPLLPPRRVLKTGYFYRRLALIIAILVLTLAELFYIVGSFVGPEQVRLSMPFIGNLTYADPILTLFGLPSVCPDFFTVEDLSVPAYLVAGCLIVYAVASLASLILSFRALAADRMKDGMYRKYRFGALCIIRFATIGLTMLCMYLLGRNFLTEDNFGIVFLAVPPFLSFFCSCFAYKKATLSVPEPLIGADGFLPDSVDFEQFVERNQKKPFIS